MAIDLTSNQLVKLYQHVQGEDRLLPKHLVASNQINLYLFNTWGLKATPYPYETIKYEITNPRLYMLFLIKFPQ